MPSWICWYVRFRCDRMAHIPVIRHRWDRPKHLCESKIRRSFIRRAAVPSTSTCESFRFSSSTVRCIQTYTCSHWAAATDTVTNYFLSVRWKRASPPIQQHKIIPTEWTHECHSNGPGACVCVCVSERRRMHVLGSQHAHNWTDSTSPFAVRCSTETTVCAPSGHMVVVVGVEAFTCAQDQRLSKCRQTETAREPTTKKMLWTK